MALIICPECKNQISEFAQSCPNCGFPIKSKVIEWDIENQNKTNQEKDEFLESLGEIKKTNQKILKNTQSNKTKKSGMRWRNFFWLLGATVVFMIIALSMCDNDNESNYINELSHQNDNTTDVSIKYSKTSLNVRKRPNVKSSVLKVLKTNEKVTTRGKQENGFTQILNSNNQNYGWCASEFLQDSPLSKSQLAERKAKESKVLKFDILKKEDISFAGVQRMVYRINLDVNSLPTDEEMKKTAISIWENGNKKWKEFTVFMYMPEQITDGPAFGIAEFNQMQLTSFSSIESTLYGTKWEIKKIKKTSKEVPVSKLKEYIVNLSADKTGSKEIKITIETDFPDGTNFLVSVGRIHYLQGESEEYSGKIFDKDFSVNHGKIETIVKVNDSDWYNEHQSLVKALPDDIKPISKISDNLNISVLYSAARAQTNDVKKILGTRGEFITGKGVDKFGTGTAGQITTFRVSKDVNFPFQK